MTAAYYSGAWSNGAKIKLASTLVKAGAQAPSRPQTPDEHIAAMDKWVIVTGGSLERPPSRPKRRRRASSSGAGA